MMIIYIVSFVFATVIGNVLTRAFYSIPADQRRITVANVLTLSRLVLAPLIPFFAMHNRWDLACIIFIISSITDFFDGFIARYYNQKTILGACLDPIADKVLIGSSVIALYACNSILFTIPQWFLALVMIKELLLLIGGFFLYYKRGWVVIESIMVGKITMCVQVAFVVWLFLCHYINTVPCEIIHGLFIAGISILMVVSFVQYGYLWVQKILQKGSM